MRSATTRAPGGDQQAHSDRRPQLEGRSRQLGVGGQAFLHHSNEASRLAPRCVLHTSHGLKVTGPRFRWIAALETVGKDRRAADRRDGRPTTPGSCPRFATSRADDLASYDLGRAQLEGRPPSQPLALASDKPGPGTVPDGLPVWTGPAQQTGGTAAARRLWSCPSMAQRPEPEATLVERSHFIDMAQGAAEPVQAPHHRVSPGGGRCGKRIQLRPAVQQCPRRGRRTPHSSPLRSARRPAGRSAPPSTPHLAQQPHRHPQDVAERSDRTGCATLIACTGCATPTARPDSKFRYTQMPVSETVQFQNP